MTAAFTSSRLLPSSVPRQTPQKIIGQGDVVQALLAEIHRIAQTDARVLVTGESGVGKELVASYIHASSHRAPCAFVAVNCAGLPESLLESELFGHVKGSFTGAYRDKPGKFEQAHTGTLFLDEVGEMPLRMQGLLLRVLETGELQKVGADGRVTHVDCRVIAATNRNLPELIEKGLFRVDLYYRLDVVHVNVPPLRDRTEDIPLLADFFLRRFSTDAGAVRFSPEVYRALQSYSWPGNIRQLENVVQRLVLKSPTDVITAVDLPVELCHEAPLLLPPPLLERRRAVADTLYEQIRRGASFWDTVWAPYTAHDITRPDVRGVVRRGLLDARGNYRGLTKLFNMHPSSYKRLMSFLRKHQCVLPYRDFR